MRDFPVPLNDLVTPGLLLDAGQVERNCERMVDRARALGVLIRPHMKTAKSVEVAKLATRELASGITVSTVAEAEYFARAGHRDILYAVGITGHKIAPLARISRGFATDITLIADSDEAVRNADWESIACEAHFPMMIEIDCGAGRGGVSPSGDDLLHLAGRIAGARGLTLAGVLTHAGHSYGASSLEEIAHIAEQERAAAVQAAERLRAAGFPCPVVSVGSTPTALCARDLAGITEFRPGVYTLFDLDQVALGVCKIEEIALSVLTTVIGQNPRSQRVLIDAGALALSKDVSAGKHLEGVGYGWVCDARGVQIPGLYVAEVHQEHGFIAAAGDFNQWSAQVPVGTRLRILPNHACMTAAPYEAYHVVQGTEPASTGTWGKIRGW